MRAHLALMFAMLLIPAARVGHGAAVVGPPRLLDNTGRYGTAIAINNFGYVTGWHVAEDGNDYRAFVWTEFSGLVDIGTLGGAGSEGFDVNDRGQVIGWAETPDGAMHGFIWTHSTGMRDLGPWAEFSPSAINNFGVIAGSLNRQAALRMPDGSFYPLGTLGGATSVALDINDRGEVVGTSTFGPGPYGTHPFYWSAETGMIDIHQPGTPDGGATRINNRGEVAGYIEPDFARGFPFQAYVYTWTRDGGTMNIGGYPGGFIDGTDYGNVFGLNSLGQVVATSTYPGDEITRQLLWSGGAGPFVMAESGEPSLSHMGINDVGEIAGSTQGPAGGTTAAVWMTVLTSEQRADSLRALVEGLALRGALRHQDARVLMRKASDDDRFAKHVAALVRSGRLSAGDGWLLARAILVHARAQ
ncbi:MAG TPA: hypothetical protein VH458_08700 [Vicinamibacterales bacterium]|jgi:probable HAF family extracellular repeat protein